MLIDYLLKQKEISIKETTLRYDTRFKQFLKRKEILRCTLRTIVALNGHKVTDLTDFEISKTLLEEFFKDLKKNKGKISPKSEILKKVSRECGAKPHKTLRLFYCIRESWKNQKRKERNECLRKKSEKAS